MLFLYSPIDFSGSVCAERNIQLLRTNESRKVSESCIVSFQKGPGIPSLAGCNMVNSCLSSLNSVRQRLLLRSMFQCF